nr:MAG TPA: hypothetical protein [Caudoviricetes sp.]
MGRFWAVVRQQPHPSVSTDAVRNAMLSKRDPVSVGAFLGGCTSTAAPQCQHGRGAQRDAIKARSR